MNTGKKMRETVFSRRVIALAAAAAVLASGATVTSLAAWNDTEFVNGGSGPANPGVTASQFDIEQNVTALNTAASWTTNLASPGGIVDFGTAASALSPDTDLVGTVRLRSAAHSLAGTLKLNARYVAGASAFGDALRYGAWLQTTTTDCNPGDFANGTVLVPDGSTLSTDEISTFVLAAGATETVPGQEKTVCFHISFPGPASTALQGLTVDPIWSFDATSD